MRGVSGVIFAALCAVFVLFTSLPSLALAGSAAAGVLQLTPENYEATIAQDKPTVIAFTAPWCQHCKEFIPEYEQVARALRRQGITVAQVSNEQSPLMERLSIVGFPTVKIFPAKSSPDFRGIEYEGKRNAAALLKFLNKKFSLNGVITAPVKAVVTLTDENFDEVVFNPKANVLVKFFAPWCGHCTGMAPGYESAAKAFEGESSVVFAELDGDKYGKIAAKYDIQGFPTLKLFRAGTERKFPEEQHGSRAAADLVDYMNDVAGLERTVGGGVTQRAGRDATLDTLANEVSIKVLNGDIKGAQGTLPVIKASAAKAVEDGNAMARYYPLYGNAVVSKGMGFVETELDRLRRMAQSKSITVAARAELMMRANIIRQFYLVKDEPQADGGAVPAPEAPAAAAAATEEKKEAKDEL